MPTEKAAATEALKSAEPTAYETQQPESAEPTYSAEPLTETAPSETESAASTESNAIAESTENNENAGKTDGVLSSQKAEQDGNNGHAPDSALKTIIIAAAAFMLSAGLVTVIVRRANAKK